MITNDDIGGFCAKLLQACKEYRLQLDYVEKEMLEQSRLLGKSGEREADLLGRMERLDRDNARLRQELESANNCLEDVCTGAGLECPTCGKQRPCLCQDLS